MECLIEAGTSVADAVAAAVDAEGVTLAVNVPDEVTILISQALRERGIRIVRPRHEHNGVLIADGYARTSGDVGVCVVGPGPAIAQTGNALVTAQRKGSPVLVLLGQNPAQGPRGGLKDFDAQRFVESCGARYVAVRGAATLADDVHEAFRIARLRSGPVVLALPDRAALRKPLPAAQTYRTTSRGSDGAVGADAGAIEEAAALLIGARRPVPTTIPAIIGHSRFAKALTPGPANSCHTFVMNDGNSSKAAACAGSIKVPRMPIATVGKPMPVTPLTKPATTKVAAMMPVRSTNGEIIGELVHLE